MISSAPESFFRQPRSVCSWITFLNSGREASLLMPARLHRYYGSGFLHFITTSCYQRQPWLGTAQRRDLFLRTLEQVRRRYHFVVVGYVVMPEHVHLLLSEPERANPSIVMQAIKQCFARRLLRHLRTRANHRQGSLWNSDLQRATSGRCASMTSSSGPNGNASRNCVICTAIRSSEDSYWNRNSGVGAVTDRMPTENEVWFW